MSWHDVTVWIPDGKTCVGREGGCEHACTFYGVEYAECEHPEAPSDPDHGKRTDWCYETHDGKGRAER